MSSGEAEIVETSPKEEIKVVTLKIKLPSALSSTNEVLEIPSSLEETLADLKQSLNILPITRNLTNYHIYFQDINLTENFEELSTFNVIATELDISVSGELKLSLKEKPYNLASVYDHLARFRETIGLHYLDKIAQDIGVSSGVNKFNSLDLASVKVSSESEGKEDESTTEESASDENKKEEIKLTDEEKIQLKEISNDFIGGDLLNLASHGDFDKINDNINIPIKSVTISQWSPVSSFQQLKGDLLYLTLQTLENETFNITCHLSGFFVNKCSSINFNPEIKVNEKGKFYKNYLLYNLVDSLSPLFSKTIQENELHLSNSTEHPETYLLPTNAFLSYPWLVDPSKSRNQPDLSRSQLPLISNGVDGSDYIKEWNDDIQAIRELPNTTINERILKEKLLNKSLFEFNKVATETAINIIKGNLTPMNPNETPDQYIYLKNGIFYSFSANSTGVFDSTGGNEAARYTSSKDLAGIKIMNRFDIKGVSNLVTCIVDYMGKRIICQAPVPGIFSNNTEDEETDKVSYGLTTDNLKVLNDESFNEGLKQVADIFHLKPHEVQLSESIKSNGELLVSKDTKGIIGSDNRRYIIDLYRSAPLDIEFIEANWDESSETSYPHKETVIRHEAVEEWWKRKISVLIKAETEKLEKEGKNLESKDGEKPKIVLPTDQVVVNPDAFTCINESTEDQEEVRSLSNFVKGHLIEEFLNELSAQLAPFDGKHLATLLHKQGINLRYLGYIAEQALARKQKELKETEEIIKVNEDELVKRKLEAEAKAKAHEENKENEEKKEDDEKDEEKKENEGKDEDKETEQSKGKFEPTIANFDALYRISIQEMVARSVKHLLRKLSADLPFYLVPSFVSHFHNCLLGSKVTKTPEVLINDTLRSLYDEKVFEFTRLTSDDVFKLIAEEVFIRFRFQLSEDWIDSFIQPLQLFREIAIKFGIQWKSQDYAFTKEELDSVKDKLAMETHVTESKSSKKNKKKSQQSITKILVERTTTFIAEDIVNFVPIIKDSTYKASIVDDIFETARVHIIKGEKDLGITYLNELSAIYEQIYGRVNPETAKFYVNLAQVYSELGFVTDACNIARKAIILNERTNGFDSHETISTYINAAFFEVSNNDFINSFNLYRQAIENWTFVYGKDHPSLVTTLANLADMLASVQSFEPAVKLLEQALELSVKLNGEISQLTGLIYYRIGNLLTNLNKLKEAMEAFRVSNDIFNKLLGPDDFFSKQTSKYVINLANYLTYLNLQEQQKKKQIAHQAAANGNGKVKIKPSEQQVFKNNKKGNKKNSVPQPNHEIASKSVDDILKFIEGNQPKKSSKKTKKSKN